MFNFKQKGFSMVELMITVAVLGILTAAAVPSYRIWIENTRIRTGAESILNGLQKARAEAVTRNAQVRFVLGANSAWSVGCVTPVLDLDADGIDDCPAVIESRASTDGSSANITTNQIPNGATNLTYTALGNRIPPVASEMNQIAIDNSALAAADSRELNVTIGVGGNVRMCDPSALLSASDPRRC